MRFTDPDGMWPDGGGLSIPLPQGITLKDLKGIPGLGLLINLLDLNSAVDKKLAEIGAKFKTGEMRQEVGYDALGFMVLNKGFKDVGKVGTIPDLNGKSIEDVDATLKDAGFTGGEPTEPGNQKDNKGDENKGGYRTYKNEDGSRVDIKPDGSVVRSTKPRYDPVTGQRINKGEKLIKTEDGLEATRDQKVIHENRETYPERVKF